MNQQHHLEQHYIKKWLAITRWQQHRTTTPGNKMKEQHHLEEQHQKKNGQELPSTNSIEQQQRLIK